MAKLSETFTYGGGNTTAPSSIPQFTQTSVKPKLSETFSYDTKVTIPKTQPTAVPKLSQPTVDYDAVIKEYESLPKTNILSRLFNKKSEEAYNRKQELNPLYEQAKDYQTRQKLSSLGLNEKDVRNAYDESWGYGLYKVEDLLKAKGITDKKELSTLIGDIDKMFTRTAQSEANERNTKFAEEHPVLGSALTVPSKALVGMGNVLESGTNYLTGNPMSNTSGSLAANKEMNEMRDTVSKDMNGVGKFLYGSGMSMADMLANRWLLGPVGNLSMGFEKGADTMNEAIDQGLNPTQIMGKGLASGATTYITEKLLTSKALDEAQETILGMLKEGGLKALGKNGIVKVLLPLLVKSGASEGAQEGLEDVADTIADMFIAGGKNELMQSYNQYKANGLSDDEALKKVAGDKALELLEDTAGGFLSGFLMGGAEMGKSGMEYNLNNRNNIPTLNQPANNAVQQNTPVETSIQNNNAVKEIINSLSDSDLKRLREYYEAYETEKYRAMGSDRYSAEYDRNAANLSKAMAKEFPELFSKDGEIPNFNGSDIGAWGKPLPQPEYSTSDNPFEVQTNEQKPTANQNKVMAEDTGLNEKTTFKQIPSTKLESVESIEVPLSELEDRRNGATYKAQTATNTLRNSEVYNQSKKTRQMIESMIEDGTADVDRQTWLAANTEAVENLDKKGFDGVKADIMKSGTETTQTQIAESVYIVDNEIQKALESGDTTEIQRFTRRLVERMHKVGQALQALRMYGNTAAGMVTATDTIIGDNIKAYMNDADKNKSGKKAKNLKQNAKLANALKELGYDGSMDVEKAPKTYQQILTEVKNTIGREMGSVDNRFSDADLEYLARLIEHGATTEELKSALNQHLVTGYFGMSAEDLQKITDLYNQADSAKSSKESAELRKQAAAIAAKYLGKPTFMDKWNSWRYLSMLGNPRTMIRNILGNTTFGAVTDVKDAVGAVLEKAFLKEGQRTKAILNPVTDKALINACAKDADVTSFEELTEGGHKYNMKHEVEGERQIFKSKLLEGARNLTNNVLEKSDNFALKKKYAKALAGYLKANGYNADVLKTNNSILDKARAYAIEQAKEATFHADNAFADMLSDWSRSARERGGIGGRAGEVLIESIMPFKKTPANILQQGFEYSPLGMLKLVNEVRSQAGANEYINTISKALTGSTILALGAWLTSRGLLVGQRGEDEDPFNKGADYALKIGNHTYTIDWTAPAALPLFVGSELYKAFNPDESADESKNFFEAMLSVAEPAIDMSMLQGLSNTLDAIANAKNSKLGTTAANIGSGYASQVVPTLLGQVARTVDPYRRSTRTNNSSYSNPVMATLEKAEKKIANKIPVLSMTNEKYLDAWGEPQKNSGGNILGRAFQNFISPGYLNDTSLSSREQKLAQLERTYQGKGSLIPSLADNNKPSGGRMSNEEYSRWAKTRGDELKKAVDAALWHKGRVPDADLQDYIHDIEQLANAIAKNRQFGTEIPKTYKKKYEAYKKGGYSAVIKYLIETSK